MPGADTALLGKRILVTRPAPHAAGLCQLIEQAGGQAVTLPLLAIESAPLPAGQRQAARRDIAASEIIIFISQAAVQQFAQQFAGQLAALQEKQLIAVGDKTRRQLAALGVGNVLTGAAGMGSEALLRLPALGAAAVQGRRILIVKGHGGRTLLYDRLRERGAGLATLALYRRRRAQTNSWRLTTIWRQSRPHSMIFTSGQGLAGFVELAITAALPGLYVTPVVVFGGRMAAEARAAGFAAVTAVDAASDMALLQALYRLHASDTGVL